MIKCETDLICLIVVPRITPEKTRPQVIQQLKDKIQMQITFLLLNIVG